MKSARSINTTNLDVSICKQCPRGIQLIIRKFPTSQQIKAASNRSQLDTVVSQSFSSFGDPIQFPIRTTQCRECEFHCLNHECWSWDRRRPRLPVSLQALIQLILDLGSTGRGQAGTPAVPGPRTSIY